MKWEYSYVTSAGHANYGTATNLIWRIAGGQRQIIMDPPGTADRDKAAANSVAIQEARSELLARLGQEEWEMVGFQGWTFYFKRPITD